MWCGRGLTKRQATSRLDHLWPEILEKYVKKLTMKEKQNWSSERPKLENARKLRDIRFIDPEGKDFVEVIKNARKHWKYRPLLLFLAKGQKAGTE